MRAGPLDRRLSIERATITRDAFNNPKEAWNIIATVWASVEQISDGERWRAQEVGATATMRFQIRWSDLVADVNPKDRLIYEGREFNIAAVKELGRRRGLELTAAARTD